MNPSSNLILVGPMGAGKSSIGKRLADLLKLRFVDADHELEARAGTSIATMFACEGEAGFRRRERQLLQALLQDDGQLLATGGGAILDADNRALLRTRGFVVYLHLDVARQLQRLEHDRSRPLLQSADRTQALQAMARLRTPLYAQVADLRLDTSALTCQDACIELQAALAHHWQRETTP